MAEILTLPVGPLEVNCYIVWDKASGEGAVVDPGGDVGDIKAALAEHGVAVRYIINTHGHFDHIGGNGLLKEALGAPIAIHRADEPMLEYAHEQAVMFGLKTPKQPKPDMYLADGDIISFGALRLQVIHTPGHTKGGVCLYMKEDKLLFTGDTLFAGSIGRTDFEGGSMDEIMDSIMRKILPLGDSVRVFPGHGPSSTIGEEKEINPFIVEMKRVK
ncbi:MAG TPA: MBL fold metallo-hydrolase [Deltaproteobacteria bacterium]|nr:MAG: MBL fold metallo-hydrolase [Deltaproteobacteria bacterium GWA2_55_82]OGQ64632.1 MAG: MBL fold metallo-hydrolase [Deltaproteobacteria bacterium RIFCSPLOWO2_02_FULL_55_12]OIJ73732.1 MAG: MBL fold metallo-hydrolase [Deltaproteobacteria bacterium GWC2_55_46]HBG45872.1 MBL fold metallo-hydrolase [Deltaproteobacteria bacterium]HCY09709.1 MBL fold metallo-hydrolase [Deltaproteobacteria bacterium]